MKKLLYGLVGLVVIIVAALWLVPPMIANSVIKNQITSGIEDATGRKAEIGELSLSVLPSISVRMTDLKIANDAAMPTPEMVVLGSLDLDLGFFPLLSKSVEVDRLVVSDLSVFLEVAEDGRQNWVFGGPAGDGGGEAAREASSGGGGLPISGLSLGDVRLVNAKVSYIDLTSGQTIDANGLNLKASLPGLEGQLDLDGGVTVNDQPVTLALAVDSPASLAGGDPASLAAKIESALLNLNTDLSLQQKPQAAVDGTAKLDIGSVGALLSWLQQPLPADQPDPGPLLVSAVFKTAGEKVVLEEALISGDSLDARASGSVEQVGDKVAAILKLESGVLDIDRYLPPPAPGAREPGEPRQAKAGKRGHPLEGIPDEPFDLAALRNVDADIAIAIGGVKAAGYQIGEIAFTAKMTGGKLAANLDQVALYGGAVSGQLALDASGDALGLDSAFAIDQVDLGKLAAVGAEGDPPLAGIASGNLRAKAGGKSPRALVEGLQGGLDFKLGNIDVKNAAAGAISGVDIAVDLPGIAGSPSLTGDVIYNKRKVGLNVGLDPLDKILAGESFALKAGVDSELLVVNYDGQIQQEPVPGLDGQFGLDAPSVGQLMAWLGQPLPEGQPDPGPLTVRATLAADGTKVALKEATITGKESDGKPAAMVTASGSFDGGDEVARFEGKVDIARLDLNAFLPAPSEEEAPAAAAEGEAPAAQGWSEEPIDAAGLRQAEGTISLTTGEVLYRDVIVQKTAAEVKLSGGVMNFTLSELILSPGQIAAAAVVDGSAKGIGLSYNVKLSGVEAKPFLKSFAGTDILSGKMELQTKGAASGLNQLEIVKSLNGDGGFKFLDGAVEGFDLAGTIRSAGELGMGQEGAERPKTDFTELSATFTITDGLVRNTDLKMLAPVVRVTGAGDVPLPPRTMDYKVEAKLVASLKGQGGEDALAGIPVPVHAHGPWDNLAYDIDWASVFTNAALDPSKLPANLQDAAKGFGVDLPGIEGVGEGGLEGAVGGALEGVLGGGDEASGSGEEGSGKILDNLLGGSSGGEAPAPATEGEEAPKEESPLPGVTKKLKSLF